MNYTTLLELYNEFASENNYELIYSMDDLDDILGGLTPTEIVSRIGDNFNIHDNYIQYNGLGFINSFDNAEVRYSLDIAMEDCFGEWLKEKGYDIEM